MIAKSFKSVLWVGGVGAAALTCYMFSMQVAEERADLSALEAQIARTRASIQTLKTELGTRSRVHQLQHWATSDFGFVAPGAGQFLPDEVTLASLDMPAEAPLTEAPVRMADAQVAAPELPRAVQASAPAPAPERPAVRQASARSGQPPEQAPERPLLRRASATSDEAPAARPRDPALTRAARTTTASAPAPRPASSIVNPRTLRDIERRADAERGGERGGDRGGARQR